MSERTDGRTPLCVISGRTGPEWRELLLSLGLAERSAKVYGGRLGRFEQELAAGGVTLATCDRAHFRAAVESIDWAPTGWEHFRTAIGHGLRIEGRHSEVAHLLQGAPIPRRAPRDPSRNKRPRKASVVAAVRDDGTSILGCGAFEETGVSHRTAYQYVRLLAKAAGILAGVGQDLASCDEEGIAELSRAMPTSRKAMLRTALRSAWHITGRESLPSLEALQAPRRVSDDVEPDPAAQRRAEGTARARQLLTSMMAHGWTRRNLAGRLGVTEEMLRPRTLMIDPDLAQDICALADALLAPEAPPGPGSRRFGGGAAAKTDPRFDMESIMALGMAKRTAYRYGRILTKASAVLQAERGTDLDTCTAKDLMCLLPHFPSGYSSRQGLRAALKAGFEILDRTEVPSLKAVRLPPKPQARSRALTHEDAIHLEQIAWARKDKRGLAVVVGLYAALRREEIALLSWEQVIDDTSGRPQWLKIIGKGEKEAMVPLNPNLAEALLEWREPWSAGPLFPGRWGGPVTADTIWRWTKEVAGDAGLRITTHQLRHTALTEAHDATSDLRGVQEMARHSKPETTAIYTRVTGQRLLKVAAAIDYNRRVDGDEPDPADDLPGVTYRQLLEFFGENEERQEAWVALGRAAAAAGWRLELMPDVPGFHWVHPAEPLLWASPGGPYPRVTEALSFDLIRQGPAGKDCAEMWALEKPEHLLVLAELLISGAPAPECTIWLGAPDEWPDEDDEDGPLPFAPLGPTRQMAASSN
jgi:integrase